MSSVTIPAATVILLRDAPPGPPEILMIERGAALAFAGGAMVFPGGRVDPGDLAIARDPKLATGFDGLDDGDAAARVACARETFEETGLWLASGPAPEASARAALIDAEDESATFAALLHDLGATVDADRFVAFARWEPPAAAPIKRRFDTRFYLADAAGHGEASADGGEAVALAWTTPQAALARNAAGQSTLVFPTKCNLERLAQYDDVAALLDSAVPPPFIQPEIINRDGTAWLTIPADCDYPVTAERLDGVRRE